MKDYGEIIMPCGRHKDRPLWYILDIHQGYYFWFLENTEDTDLKSVMMKYLEQEIAKSEAEENLKITNWGTFNA